MAQNRGDELVRPIVSGVVLRMRVPPEVGRLGIVQGGDDVPAHAAAEHVIKRSEHSSHMKRLVVRRRIRSAHSEVPRREPHRCHQGDQIHLHHADTVAHRLRKVVSVAVGHCEPIVEEGEVKPAGFENAGDSLIVLRAQEIDRGRRVTP